MKGMKKLLSILMVLTLVLSLGASAFAATVTINDEGHEYTAYQIFKGANQQASEGAIGDLDWGDGITPETFISALETAGISITKAGATATAQEVAKALSEIEDKDTLHKIAVAAKSAIKGSGTPLESGTTELGIGYYLIVDTTENLPTNQMQNDLVLQVTQDITVTPKRDVPTSEKKVKEKNDTTGEETTWQDAADYDIGDHVPFQLKGTLPDNYTSYEKYEVTFHDKQSDGLTFDKNAPITVTCGGTTVTLPNEHITVSENVSHGERTDTFDIKIDVKNAFPGASNSDEITVEYTSTLNEKAVIAGDGNPNTMHMEYTNKFEGGSTTETPDDAVIVFTFDTIVNKVEPDGEGKTRPLAGAGFTLYKKVSSGGETLEGHDGNYIVVGNKEITGGTSFDFSGLDSGKYVLVETTVPAGYNKADDIEFEVKGVYNATSRTETPSVPPTLTDIQVVDDEGTAVEGFTVKIKPDDNKGSITTDVVNQQGVTLPETGGIGTTIFYVAGAILVAGAAILLVTKKRVNGAEK